MDKMIWRLTWEEKSHKYEKDFIDFQSLAEFASALPDAATNLKHERIKEVK